MIPPSCPDRPDPVPTGRDGCNSLTENALPTCPDCTDLKTAEGASELRLVGALARWRLPDAPRQAPAETTPTEHAKTIAGLMRAALQRPPTWPTANGRLAPGCWCAGCEGINWRPTGAGWSCTACHPQDEACS